MKKFLGILVLGLILSGCATYTAKQFSGGDGKIVKAENDKILLGWDGMIWTDDSGNSGYDGSRWYHVESDLNKETASQHCTSKDKFAYFFDDYTIEDHLDTNAAAIFICSAQYLEKSPISGKSISWGNFSKDSPIYKKGIIANAKKLCKEMGFKSGSDKLAGCVLQVAMAEFSPQQGSSGSSGSSSGVTTIYDPSRDSREAIERGQRMISGACTLGIDC